MTTTDKKPKQMRGDALIERIRDVVTAQAQQAQAEGRPYVMNKAAIARDVPCTRKTLAAHDETLSEIFSKLFPQTARKARDGSIELQRLKDKLSHAEKKIQALEAENRTLVAYHTLVFDRLTMAGIAPSILADIHAHKPDSMTGPRLVSDAGDTVVAFHKDKPE